MLLDEFKYLTQDRDFKNDILEFISQNNSSKTLNEIREHLTHKYLLDSIGDYSNERSKIRKYIDNFIEVKVNNIISILKNENLAVKIARGLYDCNPLMKRI